MGDQTEHRPTEDEYLLDLRIRTIAERAHTDQVPLTALRSGRIVSASAELRRRVKDAMTREVCLKKKLKVLRRLYKKQMEDSFLMNNDQNPVAMKEVVKEVVKLMGDIHDGELEDVSDTLVGLVCRMSDLEAKNSDLESSNERLRNEKQFLEDRVTMLREERGNLAQEHDLQGLGFSYQLEVGKLVKPPHPAALVPVSTDYSGPGRVVRDCEGNLFTTKPQVPVPDVICLPRYPCDGAQMMGDIAMSPTVCDPTSVGGWSDEERDLYGD